MDRFRRMAVDSITIKARKGRTHRLRRLQENEEDKVYVAVVL
ncbi:MAG: hypothetical protein QXP91_12075 [Candidatus Methanomethylicia archaeon]